MQNDKTYTRVPLEDRLALLEWLTYHTSCCFIDGSKPNEARLNEDAIKDVQNVGYADGALWFIADEQTNAFESMSKKAFCTFIEARHPQDAEWVKPQPRGINIADMINSAMEEQLRGRAAVEALAAASAYLERHRESGCDKKDTCPEPCSLDTLIQRARIIVGLPPQDTDTPEA